MKITSDVFENNQSIPKQFTCDGGQISPALSFSDIPGNAKSLVLIMDDPDAPMGTFDHWVVYNISPKETGVAENNIPTGSFLGKNGTGKQGYIGPCPPSGIHHYHFKLYALDTTLSFSSAPDKAEVEKVMEGHIIEQAELVGLYQRS